METHDISIRRGTTWKGMQIAVEKNGTPIDLTGAVISMKMRKRGAPRSADLDYQWTIGNGITVTSAANGLFMIDPTDIDLSGATYLYEIDTTLADGTKETWFGGNFVVEDDIG